MAVSAKAIEPLLLVEAARGQCQPSIEAVDTRVRLETLRQPEVHPVFIGRQCNR
jgi:hypothetical protein